MMAATTSESHSGPSAYHSARFRLTGLSCLAVLLAGCQLSHPPLLSSPVPAARKLQPLADSAAIAEATALRAKAGAVDAEAAANRLYVDAKTAQQRAIAGQDPAATERAKADLAAAEVQVGQASMLTQQAAATLAAATTAKADANRALETAATTPTLADILDAGRGLQTIYANGYAESAKISDILQLPVIAAAVWGADTVLRGTEVGANATETTRRLGRIGIGITAFSAAQRGLFPSNLPAIYMDGHLAVSCVLWNGDDLGSAAAASNNTQFEGSRWQLELAVIDVKNKIAQLTPDETTASAAAILYAQSELQRAGEVATAAGLQAAAWNRKEAAFQGATSVIAYTVAKRAGARTAVSYDDLRNQMFTKPTTPAPAGKDTTDKQALTMEELAKPTLLELAKTLAERRAALATAMPNYVERISALDGCVTRAGTAN